LWRHWPQIETTHLKPPSLTSQQEIQLKDRAFKMFAPRFQSLFRPASNRASQCLQQQRAIIPRSSIFTQIQRRYQSNPSAARAAKALFKAYPYSVSLAFGLYVSPLTAESMLKESQHPLRSRNTRLRELHLPRLHNRCLPQVSRTSRKTAP